MSLPSTVQSGCAPPLASPRGAIRWICTNIPFYRRLDAATKRALAAVSRWAGS